jgi:hypothetical protein
MNDRFAPIAVGKVAPAPTVVHTSLLPPANPLLARYSAQDEMAEYAQTLPRHVRPTDIDHLTTLAERRETTLRRMVNDDDMIAALGFLHERQELPDWVFARLEEVSMEYAEKRLNRSNAA